MVRGRSSSCWGSPCWVDGTGPAWSDEVEVRDGGDVDADCILGSPGAVFQASWTPAADAESGIVQYEWCIGSTGSDAGRDDLMPCRLVGDSLEASALVTGPDQADDGFTWPAGGTLFVSVCGPRVERGHGAPGSRRVAPEPCVMQHRTPPVSWRMSAGCCV